MLPFILPVSVTVIVPVALALLWGERVYYLPVQVPIGLILIGFGLFLLVWTVGLFRRIGKGSLASWDPTQRLVVEGPYAHTRNPMISGVLSVLLGEGVRLGSLSILAWALLFFVINVVYFKLSEEPGLLKRFGDEYVRYRENVPMWLPRRRPWRG